MAEDQATGFLASDVGDGAGDLTPDPAEPVGRPDTITFDEYRRSLDRAGALGHDDDAVPQSLPLPIGDLVAHLVDVEGDFGNENDVGGGGHAGMQRNPSGIPAHEFHHHHPVVRFRGRVEFVDGLGGCG